jgi:hypothetical protein
MNRPRSALVAVSALLLTAGCLNTESTAGTITLDFDFDTSAQGEGWAAGASDFPVARAADVGAVGDRRLLPAPISTTRQGLYQAGTNVSGDLFLFFKKRLIGLAPGASYTISISLEFASNLQSGCTTGPGPQVWLKAGVSALEPTSDPDAGGTYRMSIDKGNQSGPGLFTQLGDIRNGLSGCPAAGSYALRGTAVQVQPTTLVTDAQGGFWIFIGTQSTALARHEVYFNHLRIKFQ